jgi:hypothetical protein
VFPQSSTAVHVRVSAYESGQGPFVRTSLNVTGTDVSQLSVAVGAAGAGTALHSTVMLPGTPESTGGVVSRTVTTCVRVAVFPQLSAAVHVRVNVYESMQGPSVRTSL